MKKGQKINHGKFGRGILINVTDKSYVVDFNGEEKILLKRFTELESVEYFEKRISKKKIKKVEKQETTINSIYSSIVGNRITRHNNWQMTTNFSTIMQKADEVGSFVSKIVEDAIDGKNVSDKQAWAVAYFAKKHNLIND